jgi:two-component system phosphate regulon sensor histidine kinase PhoR
MKKFRLKLTVTFIFLIGLSVLGSGILAAKILEESHIKELQQHLLREIKIILATIPWEQNQSEEQLISYFDAQAEYLGEHAGVRITFMNAEGVVLGDSNYAAAEMDNHLYREEIIAARDHGSFGYSVRYSDTLEQEMLNVASPVFIDGEIAGYLRLGMTLNKVEEAIYRLWIYIILGLLILFLAAALISYRIAKGMIKPLENIMEVAEQITDMNYKSRVEVRNKDDFGKLGEAINKMAYSLQLQMNRILENENRLMTVLENMVSGVIMIDREQRIVLVNRSAENILGFSSKELLGKQYDQSKQSLDLIQLVRECFEKRESIREEMTFYYPEERVLEINMVPLFAHNEWAGIVIVMHDISPIRRLERMRSEFVANVSHELKTPIASVRGFAETLLAGAMDDKETAKSFLKIIYDESERLNRLISDILDLSKIESQRVSLQFSPVDMKHFVKTSIHMMKSEALKKDIDIEMDVSEGIFLEADEDRLRQIFINLISNGINYTPEGGRVKIKVEPVIPSTGEEYDSLRISVTDTGIGIPKKDLPRIFERFYRVDKARSRVSGGTGLGLSIVKHLVELHKGSIEVQSEVGMGTRITIELPIMQ